MYKVNLALNNQQWLICNKTQPTINLKANMAITIMNNKSIYMCNIHVIKFNFTDLASYYEFDSVVR